MRLLLKPAATQSRHSLSRVARGVLKFSTQESGLSQSGHTNQSDKALPLAKPLPHLLQCRLMTRAQEE
jgi:hypothetical protein